MSHIRDWLYLVKLKIKGKLDDVGVIISSRQADLRNSIVLTGSPRSGTTWLMEILGTLSGYKTIFEPLHIEFFPEVVNLKLSPKPYLEPNQEHLQLKEYLKRVFEGRVVSRYPHYRLNDLYELYHRLRYMGVVAKFVRANRLLPWIAENFQLKGFYVIFRHPCATIASQMRYCIYGYFTKPNLPPNKVVIQEALMIPDVSENSELVKKVLSIDSSIKLISLSWALDTYIPLKYRKYYNFNVVLYEDIVNDPMSSLIKIFEHIDKPVPNRAYTKLKTPSMLAYDLKTEKRSQLSKWKDQLSERQVREILEVVSWFGLDFYTENPEPDYEALEKW